MGVLDSLREEVEKPDPRIGCVLCDYIATLEPDVAEEFSRQLRRPLTEVSHANVTRALAREGLLVSAATVGRHRRGHGRADR